MINKLASIFLPKYPDSSPSVPSSGKADGEGTDRKEAPSMSASRRAMRKYKEKYNYRTMDKGLESQFDSTPSNVNSKEPRQHLTP